ncbi:MAG: sensor histidine kinase [Hyphomicrobiales bacterium]
MFDIRKRNILFRVLIIYIVNLIIKGFDFSFGRFLDITVRGIYFTIMFIVLWLLVWGAGVKISKLLNRRHLLRHIAHIILGFAGAWTTSHLYRVGDICLYDNHEIWDKISLLNPELTFGLFLFYILGYIANEYIKANTKIKEEQLLSAQLSKENALAHYKALKAQIEPHFLFNSLSVLSSLVHLDADLASDFIIKLSNTLRYILEKGDNVLVSLKDEIKMVKDYYFLLETRFKSRIYLNISIDDCSYQNVYLPPTSIQELVANAVNHNKHCEDQPLVIDITICQSYIIVSNNINRLEYSSNSTGTGLNNIIKRYKLLSGQKVLIHEENNQFIVKLPVLHKDSYEGTNN